MTEILHIYTIYMNLRILGMKKNDTLIVKINDAEKKEFLELCKNIDTSASREVRHFIRKFIAEHTAQLNK